MRFGGIQLAVAAAVVVVEAACESRLLFVSLFSFIAMFYYLHSARQRRRADNGRKIQANPYTIDSPNTKNAYCYRRKISARHFLPKLVYVIEPPFILNMPDEVGGDVVIAGLTEIDGPVDVYSTVVCCCCICSFWRKLFNATSKPRA